MCPFAEAVFASRRLHMELRCGSGPTVADCGQKDGVGGHGEIESGGVF